MPLPPVDPAAAWANWEIAVRVGTGRVRVPPRTAADWLLAAWGGGGVKYLLELGETEDTEWLAMAMLDDEVELDQVVDAAHEALEQASGWKWWIAENLLLGCGAAWPQIGGELMLRGVRPAEVNLGQWLAATYSALTRNGTEKDVNAFDQKLAMPPASAGAAGEAAMEEMAAAMFGQMISGGAAAAPFPG